MRLKPSICALIVCSALAYSYPVGAQEGKAQPDPETPTAPRSEPDPVLTESENRTNKLTPAVAREVTRDSVQIKPAKPFKPAEKIEKEEDPLSFNFLYYIIEKFKMSDIIE